MLQVVIIEILFKLTKVFNYLKLRVLFNQPDSYRATFTLIQKYNEERHISHLMTFRFNDIWYFNYYDEKEQKYLILKVE